MMKNTLKILVVSLMLGGSFSFAPIHVSDAYAQSCLSNAAARKAVRSGAAKSLSQVKSKATRGGGKIVSAQLCKRGSGFIYAISVLKSNGQVSNVTVSAN